MNGCTLLLSWLNLINGRPLGILRTAFIWPLSSHVHCNSIERILPHCRKEACWLSLSTVSTKQYVSSQLLLVTLLQLKRDGERMSKNRSSKRVHFRWKADVSFWECFTCIHFNQYCKAFAAKTDLRRTLHKTLWVILTCCMKWTTNLAVCSTPVQHVIHLKASLI